MVSLTTVYIVSVLLTSVAGIGSAFLGKRFVGGSVSITEVPEPEILLPNTEQTESPTSLEQPQSVE